MTKSEAKDQLNVGEKITHWLFTDNEYIYKDGGVLKCERGYHISSFDFWSYRKGKNFDSGWSIYKEPENQDQ